MYHGVCILRRGGVRGVCRGRAAAMPLRLSRHVLALRPSCPTATPHARSRGQINAMYAPCRAQSRNSNLTGITPGARPPFVCQLWPGMFVHEEIDG